MLSNRPGKLNNHLEAAIHEAMSELDKMSGTVSNSTPPLLKADFKAFYSTFLHVSSLDPPVRSRREIVR